MSGGLEATAGEYRADEEYGPEVDVDLGGGDIVPTTHFGAAGLDAPPLPDDWVAAVALDGVTETVAAVGYSDDTERVAKAGEFRAYARDASGAVANSVYLQADGSITVTGAGGAEVTMDAAGAVKIAATSVSLSAGTDLGKFLGDLQTGINTWVPVPMDGGAALKVALATWLALPPPGP